MLDEKQLLILSEKTGIDKDNLTKYKKLFEFQTFQIGDIINPPNVIPNKIGVLLSGDIRLNALINSGTSRITLGIISDNYFVGLSSLRLKEPAEFLTASSKVEILFIPLLIWEKLLSENKAFSKTINGIFTTSELWYLLSNEKLNLPYPENPKELRKYTKNILRAIKIFNYHPGQSTLKEIDSKKFNWLIVDGNIKNFEKFEVISKDNFAKIIESIEEEVTFIGFPVTLWSNIDIKETIEEKIKDISSPMQKQKSQEVLVQSNNEKVEKKDSIESSNNYKNEGDYKFFSSGKGSSNIATACFRMLAAMLNLPLKQDVVNKLLIEESKRTANIVKLDLCAAIGESYGLQTQLVEVPIDLMPRIQTPAFIQFPNDEISIIFQSNKFELLVGRPLTGIEKINHEDLKNFLGEKENKFLVLLFRKTERTPEKKLDLSWFKPSIIKNRRPLIEVLIASIFVQVFQLMNPLIIQQIIDKVLGENAVGTLPVLAILLFAFSLFENILTAVRTNLFIDTTNRIDISLGEQVIDHLLRLPLSYFDKRPVGELSSRLGELEQIRSFLTGTALTVLLDSIFSVIYIAVMLAYSWVLTIVSLLVAPLLALITFSISPVIRGQLRTKAVLNAKTQNHLVEVLTGIQTVKAQNFELSARWKWKEKYSKYISEGFRNAVTSTTTNSLTQFLNQASSLGVLCVGSFLVIKGDLTLGQLIAFRIISGYVTTPLLRLCGVYQNFQQTSIALERLSDILNTPQESTDTDRSNIPMKEINGAVKFEDVSFRFASKGPLQLSKVDIEINPGEFTAIVGTSGSGKSTLVKLLPRLYEPLSGKITIDDYDINKVELYSLRRQIGIVPQDSLLFEGSVQENIALTNENSTSDEIIAAAKTACAHDFVMSLSAGYNSPVGERGTALSGGQRQRLAIARTILQNPNLLIMDEATSALDYETERKVSLNIMNHFRGRTVFFITHRLNSITHADKIILMHNGMVDEIGTHDELISRKGRYFALFNQQESNKNID